MAALVCAGAMEMIASAPACWAARKQQHLQNRHTRAAEYHWQSPVNLFQHGVEIADALFFAQKIELTDHHRPNDAVLAAAAAGSGRAPQIGGVNRVILGVRRG